MTHFGSSASGGEYLLRHTLTRLHPTRVVDFGAGAGKQGRLVRSVLPDCDLEAVEGHQPAAEALRAGGGPYTRVSHGLIEDWMRAPAARGGLAIFGDVLEHLPPRTLHQVIRQALARFDHVVAIVPLHDLFQDDIDANTLETHRTYVTRECFRRYAPLEEHVFYSGHYTLLHVLLTRQRPVPLTTRVIRGTFHTAMLALQPVGLARPTVALLKRLRRHAPLLRHHAGGRK